MDNLSACARAARFQGLSYGQYMATKPYEPQPEYVDYDRLHYCDRCGERFYTDRKNMKYCPDCRDLIHQEKVNAWNVEHKPWNVSKKEA